MPAKAGNATRPLVSSRSSWPLQQRSGRAGSPGTAFHGLRAVGGAILEWCSPQVRLRPLLPLMWGATSRGLTRLRPWVLRGWSHLSLVGRPASATSLWSPLRGAREQDGVASHLPVVSAPGRRDTRSVRRVRPPPPGGGSERGGRIGKPRRASGGWRRQRRRSATDSPADQRPEVQRPCAAEDEGEGRCGDASTAAAGGEGSGGCRVGEDAAGGSWAHGWRVVETRRTPWSAVRCNTRTNQGWRKPSRWWETTRTERVGSVAGSDRSRLRPVGARARGHVDGGEVFDVRRRMTSREAGPCEMRPRTRITSGDGESGVLDSTCRVGSGCHRHAAVWFDAGEGQRPRTPRTRRRVPQQALARHLVGTLEGTRFAADPWSRSS